MSEPTVTVARDGAGRELYFASGSKDLRLGLENGSLTLAEEEPREAETPDTSESGDTLEVDSGPSDGPADDRPGDDRPDESTAKPGRRS